MLNTQFIGKTIISYNGSDLNDKLGTKVYAIICLMISAENKCLSRDKIIGYLWPDSTDDAAKYNLRYNLWLIKKHIGDDENGNKFLQVDKECCGINPSYEYYSDLIEIMSFNPSDDDTLESVQELSRLFRGDYLEGFYFKKCDEFNDLIIFERITFEKRKAKILKRLTQLYLKNQLYEKCLETISEVLEIEPYDEDSASKKWIYW